MNETGVEFRGNLGLVSVAHEKHQYQYPKGESSR